MVIAVLADPELKLEFLSKGIPSHVEVLWPDSVSSLRILEADAYFDLMFDNDPERTSRLLYLLPNPVFINSVVYRGKEIGASFTRINAWPTFLKRDLCEIALTSPEQAAPVNHILNELGWKYQLVPDITGMLTPRVVAMIINEAWFALEDGVSTREEIDIAMKLGTNYPFGPFEWGEKIGMHRIKTLLDELSRNDKRYTPAPSLNI